MLEQVTKKKGGRRPGAGRKKGAIQKLSGCELLKQIQRTTGKPFAQLLAEHYRDSYLRCDWQAVRDYEKTILAKVIADKVDITSDGQHINTQFVFPKQEILDWQESEQPTLPITYKTI
jgi:hypothetical protein